MTLTVHFNFIICFITYTAGVAKIILRSNVRLSTKQTTIFGNTGTQTLCERHTLHSGVTIRGV